MTLRTLCIFVTGLAIALLSCGCPRSSTRPDVSTEPKPLKMGRKLQFDDIPVPFKFKLLASRSFAHQATTFRYAKLMYEGETSIDEVADFYKKQMIICNWQDCKVIQRSDTSIILQFHNTNELCLINITRKRANTLIEVSLNRLKKKR